MLKLARVFLSFSWAIFVLKIMTLPMPSSIDYGFSYLDKIIHLVLFASLTFLVFEAANVFIRRNFWQVAFFAFIFNFFYAYFLEYYQQFIPGRFSSIYDLMFAVLGSLLTIGLMHFFVFRHKPKILLHLCCSSCAAYAAQSLQKYFQVSLFFYNPNIFPSKEYYLRLKNAKKLSRYLAVNLIVGGYNHQDWLNKIKGHETDREKGERCFICYKARLKKTAQVAQDKKFSYFTTTLTVSPHKLAEEIIKQGKQIEEEYGIKFLAQDFKKQDGFKKSVELAKKLKLYRQEYCGCEFSLKNKQ